jgi:hypothetical protein
MRRASLFGSLLVLLSCSTLVPSEVLVHIDADPISRARARELHVRIVSEEGVTRLDRAASLFGDPPEIKLPTTVPVVPKDGDSARTFTVFAELTDQAKVAFNKKAATLSFVDQTLVDVDLFFSDLCIGIDCPAGQTCGDGACVDIKSPPHGQNGPLATDAQPAYCDGILCWEEPRPGGQGARAACLWAPDAGLVVTGGWALVLQSGLWIAEPLPAAANPQAVACWSGGEAIATTPTGILERSANGWTALDLGATALHGVWGLDSSDVWAVGGAGAIWRRKDHGAWAKVTSGVSADLLGISGIAANDLYVVGAQSTLLHYDGTSFVAVPGPAAADPSFTHVAGTSKGDLAVKAGTSVWTFDGKAWSEYAPFLGVVSLTGGPSGLLIAGGSRGTAHFRSKVGAPWGANPVGFPFDGPALTAAAVSGQSAILGGDAGGLSHWNGSTWDIRASWLTRAYLSSIATDPDDASHAVAVGGGAVLERVGEGLWRRRVVGQGAEVKTPALAAVWMGHGLSVAVGSAGAIAESTNGHDWTLVPSGSTLDLNVIDSTGSQILAGGAAGVLLSRGAAGWSALASPIPGAPDITALRAVADGTWFAGTKDGSVWKLPPGSGSSWSKLGALPEAVTDLGVDAKGRLWACAAAIYKLEGGAFTLFDVGTSWTPHRFLLEGDTPSWFATDGILYQRSSDGTYAGVGVGGAALALGANKRLFVSGDLGWIRSGHAP